MDRLLTQFVQETGADPALAQDLLEGKSWNYNAARGAYTMLCNDSLAVNVASADEKMDDHYATVTKTSDTVEEDSPSSSCSNSNNGFHVETQSYTFTLPDLNVYATDFRLFLEKDLVESSTLRALEESGHLNWWALNNGYCQKLWPLATTGDGNCLLHAASLGMWGFHDRLLMLRKALHLLLTKGSRRHALYRRWRWQQTHTNKQSGLIYSEDEWKREWDCVVGLSSPMPRCKGSSVVDIQTNDENCGEGKPESSARDTPCSDAVYESLEELHVFALAHVLKRPIIVVADTVLRDAQGEPLAPIPFPGIYLPLECSSVECHRSPLVLAYDTAHFSALVTMNTKSALPAIVPITDSRRKLLEVHFESDPGPDFTWWSDEADAKIAAKATLSDQERLVMISRYLDLVCVPMSRQGKKGSSNGCGGLRNTNVEVGPGKEVSGNNASTLKSRRGGSAEDLHAIQCKAKWSIKHLSGRFGRLGRTLRRRIRRNLSWKAGKIMLQELSSPNTIKRRSKHRSLSQCSDPELQANHGGSLAEQGIPSVSVQDVRSGQLIVGASLCTNVQHKFMDDMIRNYLESARERFEELKHEKEIAASLLAAVPSSSNNGDSEPSATVHGASARQNSPEVGELRVAAIASSESSLKSGEEQESRGEEAPDGPVEGPVLAQELVKVTESNQKREESKVIPRRTPVHRRERISRSMSVNSVVVKCMNGACTSTATHATNFLCDICFEKQRLMMESFSVAKAKEAVVSTLPGSASITRTSASVVSTIRHNADKPGEQRPTSNKAFPQSISSPPAAGFATTSTPKAATLPLGLNMSTLSTCGAFEERLTQDCSPRSKVECTEVSLSPASLSRAVYPCGIVQRGQRVLPPEPIYPIPSGANPCVDKKAGPRPSSPPRFYDNVQYDENGKKMVPCRSPNCDYLTTGEQKLCTNCLDQIQKDTIGSPPGSFPGGSEVSNVHYKTHPMCHLAM